MKQIQKPQEKERKQRTNKIIIGSILVFLMFFSTAGFALYGHGGGSSNENGESGNYDPLNTEPVFNGRYWVYQTLGQQFYFTNEQETVNDIPVEVTTTLDSYAGQTLFIAAEDQEVITEIANNIGRYASRAQRACYGPCVEDLPEKECDEHVIVWTESDTPQVYQEDNCVFIEGDIGAVDAFLYTILDI